MRVLTLTAATAQAAIALVRREMGPDAVIIAIDQATNGRGVVVRAAAEDHRGSAPAALNTPRPLPVEARLEAFLKASLRSGCRTAHDAAA